MDKSSRNLVFLSELWESFLALGAWLPLQYFTEVEAVDVVVVIYCVVMS